MSRGHAPLSAARKRKVDITNNPEQNSERVPFEVYEPAFKNDKYLSTSVRSDKTFVPAELFLCHGENYDVILKLFMKWEHNYSCASYDCVVLKLVLGRFRCKYFTPPIWWSVSYSCILRSHKSYCLTCGVSVNRLRKFVSVHSLKM